MVMERLLNNLQNLSGKVIIIRAYDFYRPLTQEQLELAANGDFNFDHPEAFDFELLETCVKHLIAGKPVTIPKYDFNKHVRIIEKEQVVSERPDIIILEGIFMLYHRVIRDLLSLKVFVDVDSDNRLAKQVIRDTSKRYQKDLNWVLRQYVKYVKPSFEDFILPSKKYADVIIPRGSENVVAIDLLAEHIIDLLTERHQDLTRTDSNGSSLTDIHVRGGSTAILSDSPVSLFNEVVN